MIETDTTSWVIMLSAIILFAVVFVVAVFWFGWWVTNRAHAVSPYTGIPLRRLTEIAYFSSERLIRFLHDFHQYDNRIFKLNRAAFCRETGRIFQNCITWYDVIVIDWNFLQKRYPGHWVSWGSLHQSQQDAIRQAHETLEGFQTDVSSPTPSPRAIEPEYAYTKPGPLYVDLDTMILLGWQIVPETELEVLIVQKPTKITYH